MRVALVTGVNCGADAAIEGRETGSVPAASPSFRRSHTLLAWRPQASRKRGPGECATRRAVTIPERQELPDRV
jgi:hypothetical protein